MSSSLRPLSNHSCAGKKADYGIRSKSMESVDLTSSNAENPQSLRGPRGKKLFERRGLDTLTPLHLDCIKPFTRSSENLCILSAPATHIRLQTVAGPDGFVVHKCIDIRTHEFFLHPQKLTDCARQNIVLFENPSVRQEVSSVDDNLPSTKLGVMSTQSQECPSQIVQHALCSNEPPAHCLVARDQRHSLSSPHVSSDRSLGCCSSSQSGTCDGSRGDCAGTTGPRCEASSARKAKRRSRSPGTPCNVESVAWFVGAGLTGATIRPPAHRRARRVPPLETGAVCGGLPLLSPPAPLAPAASDPPPPPPPTPPTPLV